MEPSGQDQADLAGPGPGLKQVGLGLGLQLEEILCYSNCKPNHKLVTWVPPITFLQNQFNGKSFSECLIVEKVFFLSNCGNLNMSKMTD